MLSKKAVRKKRGNLLKRESGQSRRCRNRNRKFQIPELVSKQINKSIEVQDVKQIRTILYFFYDNFY